MTLVLGYDTSIQFDLFKRLLGDVTPIRLVLVLVVILAALLAIYLIWNRYNTHRKLSEQQKILRAYLCQLRVLGISIRPAMTLQDILVEAGQKFPDQRANLANLTSQIEQMLYQMSSIDSEHLKRKIKALKLG